MSDVSTAFFFSDCDVCSVSSESVEVDIDDHITGIYTTQISEGEYDLAVFVFDCPVWHSGFDMIEFHSFRIVSHFIETVLGDRDFIVFTVFGIGSDRYDDLVVFSIIFTIDLGIDLFVDE